MRVADASASPTIAAVIVFRFPRNTRSMRITASGHTKYHCSSIASDHVCVSGDGDWNAWKYDAPVAMNFQFETYSRLASPSARIVPSSEGCAHTTA